MVDIPNKFIHKRVQHKKDMAIINTRGVLVYILLETPPEIYEPYVATYHKGIKKLVVQYHNTTYGTMMASLRYYKKFRKSLELGGYEFNTYNPCVTINIIKNKQMTISFDVND